MTLCEYYNLLIEECKIPDEKLTFLIQRFQKEIEALQNSSELAFE